MKKSKIVSAAVAVVAGGLLIFAGTFAWAQLGTRQVNEHYGNGTPGGSLHDDFCTPNKDVYIENWGNAPMIVRVRLSEYMEIGPGAGGANSKAASLKLGALKSDKNTWSVHKPHAGNVSDCNEPFHGYWTWGMGGQKWYMPATDAQKSSGATVQNQTIFNANTQGAKQTLFGEVITMKEWENRGKPIGQNIWVYDDDGWAYWAAALLPNTATGLLLDSVTLKKQPADDYYYAIDVFAQMATTTKLASSSNANEMLDYKSFYDNTDNDRTASALGIELLDLIAGSIAPGNGNNGNGNTGNGNSGGSGGSSQGITSVPPSIDNTIYVPQGKSVQLNTNFDNTGVKWTYVNPGAFDPKEQNSSLDLKAYQNAVIGAWMDITARSNGDSSKSDTKKAVVVDGRLEGVTKGDNGKLYGNLGSNVYIPLDSSGAIIGAIPEDTISAGKDKKPGSSDDRDDVSLHADPNGNKTWYLGPNPDKSYYKVGVDGLLGTDDDPKVWKKDESKPIGPDNETASSGSPTPSPGAPGKGITSSPDSINRYIYIPQGKDATLSADFDGTGSTWKYNTEPTGLKAIKLVSGNLSVLADSSAPIGTYMRVDAYSLTDQSKTDYRIITVVDKSIGEVIQGQDGKLYGSLGENVYMPLNPDGTFRGKMPNNAISAGQNQKPGDSDDLDKVVLHEDPNGKKTWYLGPNPDESYYKAGPDGLLGTTDDPKVWPMDKSKPIGPGNETNKPPGSSTGDGITSVPPAVDGVIYLPQGKDATLTAVLDSTGIKWNTYNNMGDFKVKNKTDGSYLVEARSDATIGSTIRVVATSLTSSNSDEKAAVVVDGIFSGVTKGSDGKLYGNLGENVYMPLKPNGAMDGKIPNDAISAGPNQTPGNGDDLGKVVLHEDPNGKKTWYLGPNPDESYYKAGPDGMLGTKDDVKVWPVDKSKPIGPGNETYSPPGSSTGEGITSAPPEIDGKIYLPQGETAVLSAVLDGTGIVWKANNMGGFHLDNTPTNGYSVMAYADTAIGTALEVTAESKTSSRTDKTEVVVIDKRFSGVTKGSDGNIYGNLGGNVYMPLKPDGAMDGKIPDGAISAGPNQTPGNADDLDNVVLHEDPNGNKTWYLGPNPDESYYKAGSDGLLGTNDDVKVWQKDKSKPIGPGNETDAPPAAAPDFANANPNDMIKIDDHEWQLVKKQTLDGQNYAMLIANYFKEPVVSISSQEYEKSDLRKKIENSYNVLAGPVMRSIAVLPGSVYSVYSTDEGTPPSKLMAKDNQEAFFAPTYADAKVCRQIWDRTSYGFMTRTKESNAEWRVYYAMGGSATGFKWTNVTTAGKMAHVDSGDTVYARPFVWVKY